MLPYHWCGGRRRLKKHRHHKTSRKLALKWANKRIDREANQIRRDPEASA